MARKDAAGVRLITRRGYDWTDRFPIVKRAVDVLPCHSCLIDGEVVACDDSGLPVFKMLRQKKPVHLYAFDLLELNGEDLRAQPIEIRKTGLQQLIGEDGPGLMLSRTIEEPPETVFAHICALGLEGIVSKKIGSRYQSGRSLLWVKTRNPNAPAIKRLTEEEWN
jgi:bifunctional non-homologous end joining protein LigD